MRHFSTTSGLSLVAAFIVLWLNDVIVCQPEEAIRYRIFEGAAIGTRLGSVLVDSGLRRKYSKDAIHQLDFRFLSQPPIPLSIGASDAIIRTSGTIDRESIVSCQQRPTCDVGIDVAVHPVAYFRIIKLIVEVLDINDNPPRFGQSLHSLLSISESASIGSTFLLPSATDPDSPAHGVRRYELLPVYGSNRRKIGGGSSVNDEIGEKFGLRVTPKLDGFLDVRLILRQRLDRESVEEYHLTLVAFDGGETTLTDSINVTVRVLDANDNDPVFERSVYEVRVHENAPPGTRILTVTASDADAGGNGQMIYGLAAQSKAFYGHTFLVDNRTGDVFLTDRLDREMIAEYQLIVTAEDAPPGAPEVHTVDVTVHVIVDDVNDNAPRIVVNTLKSADTYVAHVAENSPSGTFVALVTVSDPDLDSNGVVNCTLDETGKCGHPGEVLRLVSSRPLLQAHQRSEADYQLVTYGRTLDREHCGEYNVSVVCTDNGFPISLHAVKFIRVVVVDENDNAPVFSSQVYTISLPESTPIGSAVLTVSAFDSDTSHNSLLRYVITPRNRDADLFDIEGQSGRITLAQPLDRELKDQLSFYVEAIDHGSPNPLTGSVQVIVRVTDVDDNDPVFKQNTFTFDVIENKPPKTRVGDVTATDIDLPPFNSHAYKFTSDFTATRTFEIDPNNGTIWTKIPLDREIQPAYYLTVCAYVRQSAPHSCVTASVSIFVTDVNDNSPSFQFPTQTNHTLQVSHLVKPGHVITTLVATDVDLDDNGRVGYELVHRDASIDDALPFRLHR